MADSLPDLPNIKVARLDATVDKFAQTGELDHPPCILLLYESLRERSFSRFLTYEAARILEHFGAGVAFSIQWSCRWLEACRKPILKSSNCVCCRFGPKSKYDAVRSPTAPSRPS